MTQKHTVKRKHYVTYFVKQKYKQNVKCKIALELSFVTINVDTDVIGIY